MNKNNALPFVLGVFISMVLTITTALADTEYTVRSTDNLNKIVNKFYQSSDLTRSQILIGILSKNPAAFKGGNINFLIRGKRLLLADETNMPDISTNDANQILAEHSRFFRSGVTGDLKPPFEASKDIAVNTSSLETKQLEQSKQINKLEKEREELRSQLDKLIAEKKERDQKLQDIEQALQDSLKQTNPVDSITE